MTGLDKIISAIDSAGTTDAEEIIRSAREECERINSESKARAEEDCAAIIAKARDDASLLSHISESGAAIEGKKMLLSARQQVVDGIIADALERLRSLPDSEYFDVISGICVRYASKGSGELVLSETDKARMPSDFIGSLNEKLADRGAQLSVAADTVETGGGFVLRYGGVEENCTFGALVEEKRELISDNLSKLLFG